MAESETRGSRATVRELALHGERVLAVEVPPVRLPDRLGATAAEAEIVELIAEGLTNREIAARRGAAPKTVANQIARLLRKAGVGSRFELVALAAAPPNR